MLAQQVCQADFLQSLVPAIPPLKPFSTTAAALAASGAAAAAGSAGRAGGGGRRRQDTKRRPAGAAAGGGNPNQEGSTEQDGSAAAPAAAAEREAAARKVESHEARVRERDGKLLPAAVLALARHADSASGFRALARVWFGTVSGRLLELAEAVGLSSTDYRQATDTIWRLAAASGGSDGGAGAQAAAAGPVRDPSSAAQVDQFVAAAAELLELVEDAAAGQRRAQDAARCLEVSAGVNPRVVCLPRPPSQPAPYLNSRCHSRVLQTPRTSRAHQPTAHTPPPPQSILHGSPARALADCCCSLIENPAKSDMADLNATLAAATDGRGVDTKLLDAAGVKLIGALEEEVHDWHEVAKVTAAADGCGRLRAAAGGCGRSPSQIQPEKRPTLPLG